MHISLSSTPYLLEYFRATGVFSICIEHGTSRGGPLIRVQQSDRQYVLSLLISFPQFFFHSTAIVKNDYKAVTCGTILPKIKKLYLIHLMSCVPFSSHSASVSAFINMGISISTRIWSDFQILPTHYKNTRAINSCCLKSVCIIDW